MKMRSTIAAFIVLVLVSLSFACKKDIRGDESDLYGVWVKGSNFGDTLWFMKKNGQSTIRVPESFNPLMPVYSEKEYRFRNGVLEIKLFASSSQEYFPISSFTWIDPGKEFTLQNSQLFMFMSSMVTYKYRKI
jgi:hypothetical protein